jgi:phospholipase/carboxylesterase
MERTRLKHFGRRHFMLTTGNVFAACVNAGCRGRHDSIRPFSPILTPRPSATSTTWAAGIHPLELGSARDALLRIPVDANAEPLPLLVLLHGAGGSAPRFLRWLSPAIDPFRVAVLVPDSRDSTWDVLRAKQQTPLDIITSGPHSAAFGLDVAFLNQALDRVFRTVAVDPMRVAVGGFSDGATYALSLGLINGDLFQRIIAFSPGFVVEGEARGRPAIFVSHGRADDILPIDRCSRRIVPHLQKRGYAMTFREFEGGHDVPDAVAREAMIWAQLT